jgi:hypothetical protein
MAAVAVRGLMFDPHEVKDEIQAVGAASIRRASKYGEHSPYVLASKCSRNVPGLGKKGPKTWVLWV